MLGLSGVVGELVAWSLSNSVNLNDSHHVKLLEYGRMDNLSRAHLDGPPPVRRLRYI